MQSGGVNKAGCLGTEYNGDRKLQGQSQMMTGHILYHNTAFKVNPCVYKMWATGLALVLMYDRMSI